MNHPSAGTPVTGQSTAVLSPIVISRLQKAAVDNGFDRELSVAGEWLAFASTQCSLRIWLTAVAATGSPAAAFSQRNVVTALAEMGSPVVDALPAGASGGRLVPDIPALHRLLRRAFQLGRSLPDELLQVFRAKTATLPRSTEVERLVVQRVGQDIFREGLMEFWEGRCAITGFAVPELLRASHIKPWAACDSDAERLDVYNGLLLAPHLDAAFDQGFITLNESGEVIVSSALDAAARQTLGLVSSPPLRASVTQHQIYLDWHRNRIFRP